MLARSSAEITASSCTLHCSAILRRASGGIEPIGAAQQQIRLNADAAQLAHRMLGRLGLQLAGRRQIGHQRQVHVGDAIAPELEAELADRLEERQALDVADRAADLAQHEVGVADVLEDELLDPVGDVRHDLHRAAQVVAVALAGEHPRIDPARRDAVAAARRHAGEALVVAEVEIGLGAVVGDVHLAVLVGTHGPRIDVEIGIELAQPDRIAARLQQRADRRRRQSFAQGRHHAAGDEDEARHGAGTIGGKRRVGTIPAIGRAGRISRRMMRLTGDGRLRRGSAPPVAVAGAGAAG